MVIKFICSDRDLKMNEQRQRPGVCFNIGKKVGFVAGLKKAGVPLRPRNAIPQTTPRRPTPQATPRRPTPQSTPRRPTPNPTPIRARFQGTRSLKEIFENEKRINPSVRRLHVFSKLSRGMNIDNRKMGTQALKQKLLDSGYTE